MRSLVPWILILIATATTGLPACPRSSASSVVSLTQETFYDFMEENPLVLANFYAPWCGYSRRLAPKFEAAAEELKYDDIPLVKIDCAWEEDLCDEYQIRSVPTMMVFRGPESFELYEGSQQPESIISHMIGEAGGDTWESNPQSYD
ncbi:protein disulfide isomerase Pdi1 [Aspergillus terreus]|uniref:Protein disulfide isomerase Pdi1 n=1 Tax=Aspergillus terreus TaxID=33178 RepID=A0A5M3Z729_ASPTE|nr:hypothetical protein ATETN484_0008047200 [Aspergillus terreus]GFF21300.1 protein disulfide isomerase Pdi1 [Aspergillus terreus]